MLPVLLTSHALFRGLGFPASSSSGFPNSNFLWYEKKEVKISVAGGCQHVRVKVIDCPSLSQYVRTSGKCVVVLRTSVVLET